MEQQRRQPAEPVYCSYQINIMKLSLALVIIKRKPPGISAKEYAARLALSFSQGQENWKAKCAKAEEELLFMRQKLVEMKLEKEMMVDKCDDFSQKDLAMDSQSQGYCSYSQPQHHGNNELYNDETDCRRLEDVIRNHTSFMNKISTIGYIKKQLSGVTHCDAKMAIQDTFIATVKALQDQEIDFSLLPSAVISDTVQSITSIMKCELFGEHGEEIVQCIRSLQDKFITQLSNSFCDDCWNKETTELLHTVILTLSTIPGLTGSTVAALVGHIKSHARILKDSLSDIDVLKPCTLDFTAQVFYLLEGILKQCSLDQLDNLHDTVLKEEDELLPNELLDQYPLFAYSVWRISATINGRLKECL